jgi:hypothetical protein
MQHLNLTLGNTRAVGWFAVGTSVGTSLRDLGRAVAGPCEVASILRPSAESLRPSAARPNGSASH